MLTSNTLFKQGAFWVSALLILALIIFLRSDNDDTLAQTDSLEQGYSWQIIDNQSWLITPQRHLFITSPKIDYQESTDTTFLQTPRVWSSNDQQLLQSRSENAELHRRDEIHFIGNATLSFLKPNEEAFTLTANSEQFDFLIKQNTLISQHPTHILYGDSATTDAQTLELDLNAHELTLKQNVHSTFYPK